jgi:23S rRNA pseudouridine2605 synthase
MADNDGNDNGRRPPGRGPRTHRPAPRGDDRPFRKRAGDKPFRRREGDERPPRRRDEERSFHKPRSGDRWRDKARKEGGEYRRGFDRPREDRPRRESGHAASAHAAESAEERIAKVIARAGVASRRDAEAMIAEGRVTLNGEVLTTPAVNVKPTDRITVDGEPLPAKERTRLWIFHKPRGLVTTARDPQGRSTVFESLPEDMPRVVAVGRLDINTEGLLLLTNDGGLAKVIAHPATGWLRRYKVRAHGDITQDELDRLGDGITIDGIEYGPVEARLDRIQGDNVWLTIGLREGKNREIKNILDRLGLQVNRLIRLSFGPFQLGDLEPGLVEEVRTKVLREQLGEKLAGEAGVDFESPVREPIAPFGSTRKPSRVEDEPAHGERRFDHRREDARPHRNREHKRPFRPHEEHSRRGEGHEKPRERPARDGERRRSVWRADEADKEVRKGARSPRRGADAKAARAASGERPHERVGAIAGREGRKVVVERLVGEPRAKPPRPGFPDRPPKKGGPSGPRSRGRSPRGRP